MVAATMAEVERMKGRRGKVLFDVGRPRSYTIRPGNWWKAVVPRLHVRVHTDYARERVTREPHVWLEWEVSERRPGQPLWRGLHAHVIVRGWGVFLNTQLTGLDPALAGRCLHGSGYEPTLMMQLMRDYEQVVARWREYAPERAA